MFVNQKFDNFASASAAVLAMVDHYAAQGWVLVDPYFEEFELEAERSPEELLAYFKENGENLYMEKEGDDHRIEIYVEGDTDGPYYVESQMASEWFN